MLGKDVNKEARQDLAAHPMRPTPHMESIGRYVAGLTYEETHPEYVKHAAAAQPTTEAPAPTFTGRYLCLTSYRRDGRGVATPVWFVQQGPRLYVQTASDAYKVRRIRRNPSVTIAPCSARGRITGPSVPARAEVLPPAEAAYAQRLLTAKYRMDLIVIRPIRALQARLRRVPTASPVYVVITPGKADRPS